jgi:hypothetical protein
MFPNRPGMGRERHAVDIRNIAEALGRNGLIVRGGFNFATDENAPAGQSGMPAKSVLLIGNAGAGYWRHFEQWRERQPSGLADPLDSWSRHVIGGIAQEVGARAVSPSDKPYLPFQQWAMRAEGLGPSPLGILMHPRYGLWHAYRGALLFDAGMPDQDAEIPIHLCDACIGKPCLNACPVQAYSASSFNYSGCLAHVRGEDGRPCREGGCFDRNACPQGTDYRYPREVQAFHMASYIRPTA